MEDHGGGRSRGCGSRCANSRSVRLPKAARRTTKRERSTSTKRTVALWRYSAKPDGGAERREVDRVDGPNGLKDDIEGISVWSGKDGKGFIVLSNQGSDNYAVYRREGDNAFVGSFHIVADPERGIDGVSETDGLDVTSAPSRRAVPGRAARCAGRSEPLAARAPELQVRVLARHRGIARDQVAGRVARSRRSSSFGSIFERQVEAPFFNSAGVSESAS